MDSLCKMVDSINKLSGFWGFLCFSLAFLGIITNWIRLVFVPKNALKNLDVHFLFRESYTDVKRQLIISFKNMSETQLILRNATVCLQDARLAHPRAHGDLDKRAFRIKFEGTQAGKLTDESKHLQVNAFADTFLPLRDDLSYDFFRSSVAPGCVGARVGIFNRNCLRCTVEALGSKKKTIHLRIPLQNVAKDVPPPYTFEDVSETGGGFGLDSTGAVRMSIRRIDGED